MSHRITNIRASRFSQVPGRRFSSVRHAYDTARSGRALPGAAAILTFVRVLARPIIAAGLLVLGAPGAATAEVEALWTALREGGAVAMMRHATAPGTGDPAHFRLEDCSTQRNLSAAGRAQARAIGERFRAHGIARARVYSSQWCRSLDTARLLGLGPVEPLPALNSFFSERDHGPAQTAEIVEFLAPPEEPMVLVTHQVNITALTDVFPRSGEIVVFEPAAEAAAGVRVLGRIPPPG